jgi:ubiquinone/menaquinone biosynthesis C-methylase UbiE
MPEMSTLARAFCTSPPYRALARRVLLPWALQGTRPTGEALEIGAGSGAMAAQLLLTCPDLRLVATDYDPDMVRAAEQTLAPFGERARVQRADATSLPFDDGRFDVVMSFAMLHHVVDWERAVAESVRVLRPGGRLVGYDLLDVAAVGMMHRWESSPTRMMRPGELEAALRDLPVTGVRTRRAAWGLVVRFQAARPA